MTLVDFFQVGTVIVTIIGVVVVLTHRKELKDIFFSKKQHG
jgi:hypothetical protein